MIAVPTALPWQFVVGVGLFLGLPAVYFWAGRARDSVRRTLVKFLFPEE
ncbi:hypothetical protein [Streptomyces sp. NPDC088925]